MKKQFQIFKINGKNLATIRVTFNNRSLVGTSLGARDGSETIFASHASGRDYNLNIEKIIFIIIQDWNLKCFPSYLILS